jgi:hypothetical protein
VNAWSWRPSTSLHRLLQRDRVDEPDEFVDQNVEVNGAVHWLRNYGAGLRTVVEAFPNFPGISNTGSSTTAGSWVNGRAARGFRKDACPGPSAHQTRLHHHDHRYLTARTMKASVKRAASRRADKTSHAGKSSGRFSHMLRSGGEEPESSRSRG